MSLNIQNFKAGSMHFFEPDLLLLLREINDRLQLPNRSHKLWVVTISFVREFLKKGAICPLFYMPNLRRALFLQRITHDRAVIHWSPF